METLLIYIYMENNNNNQVNHKCLRINGQSQTANCIITSRHSILAVVISYRITMCCTLLEWCKINDKSNHKTIRDLKVKRKRSNGGNRYRNVKSKHICWKKRIFSVVRTSFFSALIKDTNIHISCGKSPLESYKLKFVKKKKKDKRNRKHVHLKSGHP